MQLYDYNSIYDMNVFQYTDIGEWRFTRVPGGWIADGRDSKRPRAIFIPYSNEFVEVRKYEDNL